MANGWLPGYDREPTPNHDSRSGFGIEAWVIHIMEGGFRPSIDWMRSQGTSAHFAVRRDGFALQLVSLDRAARANGLSWIPSRGMWMDPERNLVIPPWRGLHPPYNPNKYTGSTENAGTHRDVWTDTMYHTNATILRLVGDLHNIQWISGVTLIGHRHIGPIHRPNCPGPNVDLGYLARLANERPALAGTYRISVAPDEFALVRQGPGTQFPKTARLAPGTIIDVDMGVFGTLVIGSRLWMHLRDGRGFVHRSLMEPV